MSKSNSIAQSKAFSVWTIDWTRVLQQRGRCRKWNTSKVQWGKYASDVACETPIHLSPAYPQLLGWGPEATKLDFSSGSGMVLHGGISKHAMTKSDLHADMLPGDCHGCHQGVCHDTVYHDISWHVKICCFRRKHGYERHNCQISVTLQLQTSDTFNDDDIMVWSLGCFGIIWLKSLRAFNGPGARAWSKLVLWQFWTFDGPTR